MKGHECRKLPDTYSIIECKMNLERLIQKLGDNGFAIISACKSPIEHPEWDNEKQSDELEKEIQSKGYSYTVGWGGYEGIQNDSYKKSFIVYNYISSDTWHENKEAGDTHVLREFAVKMCAKYQQEYVYFKEPGKAPLRINENDLAANGCLSDIESAYDVLSSCGIKFVNKRALGFQARYRQDCRGEIGVTPDIQK